MTIPNPSPDSPNAMPADSPTMATDTAAPTETLIDTARRFLQTDHVKNATPESKAEFLRSKELNEEQIKTLLAETKSERSGDQDIQLSQPTGTTAAVDDDEISSTTTEDTQSLRTIPVQTFPEYLTPIQEPKPLLSTQAILNTLYGFTSLSTLMYGTSKHVLEPLVEQTTTARTTYRRTASKNLSSLILLLEQTVSAVPDHLTSNDLTNADADADALSDVDDPAELFSRDMGTQTTNTLIPPSRSPSPSRGLYKALTDGSSGGGTMVGANGLLTAPGSGMSTALVSMEPVIQTQLKNIARVAEMSEDLANLGDQETGIARELWQEMTDFEHRMSSIKGIKEGNNLGIYGQYGYTVAAYKKDDELQKAKDNIRKLKGVLLSSRNFPPATR